MRTLTSPYSVPGPDYQMMVSISKSQESLPTTRFLNVNIMDKQFLVSQLG